MDGSSWHMAGYGNVEKMERCLLGSTEIQVPESFIEQKYLFRDVMSQDTWNKVLTEEQRRHLMTFLPKFPEKDNEEKRESLRKLFKGENFKFGNPLQNFQNRLKEGYFSPDMVKYANMCKRIKMQDHKYRQQKYYSNLLKEILLSRQRVFDQLSELPPDEPIKFEYYPPKPKENTIDVKVKKKYKRYLQEVRRECGCDGTSSEEEEGSPVQRSKKQLFKSLNPVPSPEPVTPSVHSTYSPKPDNINGDIDDAPPPAKRPRPISPSEITEDTYRKLLLKHRRRHLMEDFDEEEHPEFNTQNITLQDVISRCQASRKGGNEPDDEYKASYVRNSFLQPECELPQPTLIKPKGKKDKSEKPSQRKSTKKICEMDTENIADDEDDDKRSTGNIKMDDGSKQQAHFSFKTIKQEEPLGQFTSFFSLIKYLIQHTPDQRMSSAKLEEKVRDWQESTTSVQSTWVQLQDDWTEHVSSALKFLAGETIGMNIEGYIPFLDYKERAQQWHWIGTGRDSDESLSLLCDHWMKHKGELDEINMDSGQGATPPARIKTGYVVKATSSEEKAEFQYQEKARFDEPHKAYTYHMHGYESVVGPVKGVYSKKNDMTKAREHALLIPDRPAYVTILTLVRDAVARLPNGEGTRGDICELLKDSQFLAPGVTDSSINVVVSGALDRLHSEKDPCVKYDVNRKVWIYLHRSRTEDEFEKIHQAQAAAMKAKKSLGKPKTTKTANPKTSATGSTTTPSMKISNTMNSSSENVNVDELSPQTATQAQLLANPTLQGSPTTVSTSPRHPTQTSPKVPRQSSSSSRNTGITQSLTPAQLKLLQQAAAAQAEAEAAKAKAQAQAQAHAKATALAKAQAKTSTPGILTDQGEITTSLQKNITLSQGTLKVIPQSPNLTFTPGSKPAPPPNVTIQKPGEVQLTRQLSGVSVSTQSQLQGSQSPVSMVTKTVSMAASTASSPLTTVSTSLSGTTNPLVARLVQQMSGGQVVSVSNLLAAQRSLQQQGNQPRAPAFKLQGGNVVHKVTGGKPLQLAGKPLAHAKGQLIQLGGKGQQTLGLIQTPQGNINIIPQTMAMGNVVTVAQQKEDGSSSPTVTVTASANQSKVSQTASHSKSTSSTNPGNVVVTQLTPGNIALRPGMTVSQGKVLSQAHPGLVPAQFVLQQTPSVKSETQSTTTSAGATSILVSGTTGNQSQNLQMVRTVLSQQAGLKPGQATILISQPALQQGGTVLPQGQVIQGTRAQGKVTQGKPMYARIIAPPSNLNVKLAGLPSQGGIIQTVSTGQTGSTQNEATVLQTVNKILAASGTATVTSGTSPIATSQQILAAAVGKAAHLKETEQNNR